LSLRDFDVRSLTVSRGKTRTAVSDYEVQKTPSTKLGPAVGVALGIPPEFHDAPSVMIEVDFIYCGTPATLDVEARHGREGEYFSWTIEKMAIR